LITQLENQYGNDLLIAAMKVTAKNNKDNIGYVEGVLTKLEEAGVKDINQAREFERQFKEQMKKIEKELESVQSISRLFQ
jgi:DnaD/phage-associated family protein